MVWTRIVEGMVVILLLSFVVQWALPRNMRNRKPAARQYLQKDIVPLLVFFGLLVLGLSFFQAVTSGMILAWGWGSGVGVVADIALWITLAYLAAQPAPVERARGSIFQRAWRALITYGIVVVVGLLLMNLAVRAMGPIATMFLSGAIGIVILGVAVAVYTGARTPAA
jgi:hypothetical protein